MAHCDMCGTSSREKLIPQTTGDGFGHACTTCLEGSFEALLHDDVDILDYELKKLIIDFLKKKKEDNWG